MTEVAVTEALEKLLSPSQATTYHEEYTPVLAKHPKQFSLEDCLAVGVDRMQRNFRPLKQQVEEWRALQLSTAAAKLLIYQAFIEDEAEFPKHLAWRVHELYFQPLRAAKHNGCNAE